MKIFGLEQTRGFAERLAGQLGVALAAHEERDFEDGEFKIRPRDPVTTVYVAKLLEAVGIDAVVTLDAHNVATFENAFRCRKEHLEGAAAFAAHFAAVAASAARIVVLSPDAGGQQRARVFAAHLSARLGRPVEHALMEKQRAGGRVAGDLFAGEVRDALVVIYDDMISTGGTIVRAAHAALARGAGTVHAAATHALLVGNAAAAINDSGIASLVVTDTVADARERCAALRCAWHVLDSAAVFAAAREQWVIPARQPTM